VQTAVTHTFARGGYPAVTIQNCTCYSGAAGDGGWVLGRGSACPLRAEVLLEACRCLSRALASVGVKFAGYRE